MTIWAKPVLFSKDPVQPAFFSGSARSCLGGQVILSIWPCGMRAEAGCSCVPQSNGYLGRCVSYWPGSCRPVLSLHNCVLLTVKTYVVPVVLTADCSGHVTGRDAAADFAGFFWLHCGSLLRLITHCGESTLLPCRLPCSTLVSC